MLSVALDADQVLSDFPGREGDTVVALGQLLEEARLLDARGRDDVSVERPQIVFRQVLRQAKVRSGPNRDCLALGSFPRHLAGKGRALDMFVRKLGVDLVLAGC